MNKANARKYEVGVKSEADTIQAASWAKVKLLELSLDVDLIDPPHIDDRLTQIIRFSVSQGALENVATLDFAGRVVGQLLFDAIMDEAKALVATVRRVEKRVRMEKSLRGNLFEMTTTPMGCWND